MCSLLFGHLEDNKKKPDIFLRKKSRATEINLAREENQLSGGTCRI